MSQLLGLDGVLLGLLLFSAIRGLWRGFSYELLSLLTWGLGFFAAKIYAPAFAASFEGFLPHNPLKNLGANGGIALAFICIFVVTIFVGSLLAVVLRRVLCAVGLGGADRGLGFIFGLSRGIFGVLACAYLLLKINLQAAAWVQDSVGLRLAIQIVQRF